MQCFIIYLFDKLLFNHHQHLNLDLLIFIKMDYHFYYFQHYYYKLQLIIGLTNFVLRYLMIQTHCYDCCGYSTLKNFPINKDSYCYYQFHQKVNAKYFNLRQKFELSWVLKT